MRLDKSIDWARVRNTFGLTPMELKVAKQMVTGRRYGDIAESLGRSPHTIDIHRRGIFRKVGVHRRELAAVRIAEVGLDRFE